MISHIYVISPLLRSFIICTKNSNLQKNPPFSEPPLNLRVLNVTHREVHLEWEPGFHGGMDQYFRLQYHPNKLLTPSDSSKKYWDVYPANAKSAIIRDLDPGVEYSIDVMSINNLGESNFTFKPVIVTTSSKNFHPCLN